MKSAAYGMFASFTSSLFLLLMMTEGRAFVLSAQPKLPNLDRRAA